MIQKYKYQFLFIGNRKSIYQELVSTLIDKLHELKISEQSLVCSFNDTSTIKGNQPIVIVFGHDNPILPKQYQDWINSHELSVNIILPIYLEDFNKEITDKTLKRYNGIKYTSPEPIVSIILEGFNLLRKQRKLFISYRRTDSRQVALQLFSFFEERNFDVFLDSHSIPRGVDFQNNLFHRMMDCDAVLLLDTKDFLGSDYCKEELEKAIANRIGILRIKWSDSINPLYSGLIDLYSLGQDCNSTDILNEKILEELSIRIESLRVRSLASRQDALTTEFIETASRKGKKAIQIYPNIIQIQKDDATHIYFAAIGVPTSETFHYAEELLNNQIKSGTQFTLIYDDLTLLQRWINHLDWLSNRSKLSILKKSQFENEL